MKIFNSLLHIQRLIKDIGYTKCAYCLASGKRSICLGIDNIQQVDCYKCKGTGKVPILIVQFINEVTGHGTDNL